MGTTVSLNIDIGSCTALDCQRAVRIRGPNADPARGALNDKDGILLGRSQLELILLRVMDQSKPAPSGTRVILEGDDG